MGWTELIYGRRTAGIVLDRPKVGGYDKDNQDGDRSNRGALVQPN